MTFFLRSAVLVGLIVLVDWYFFQAISTVIRPLSAGKRSVITWAYWGFTLFSVVLIVVSWLYPVHEWSKFGRVYVVSFVIIVSLSKLLGIVFVLVDDVVRGGRWLANAVLPSAQMTNTAQQGEGISRMEFLNQLALAVAAVPFFGFVYGMVRGAFNYTVHRSTVQLPTLPEAFHGLKIVHISDMHIGSFTSPEPLKKAVQIINAQKPDVIFFTGDLVNNLASETDGMMDVLKQIQAPLGVFSSIGNHDYGDYVPWESKELKQANFERLKQVHAEAGWTLLMNEHRILERDGQTIAVLGVENWGAAMNFPKRGDLQKAYAGSEPHPVKLLLSHDPSHWDAQVTTQYNDIAITFSGHTHGAQFGVEIPGFRWSPVQYFYKQWAGLYRKGEQYLYVNRGLGFLGYPGRVGISPEITVLQLERAAT